MRVWLLRTYLPALLPGLALLLACGPAGSPVSGPPTTVPFAESPPAFSNTSTPSSDSPSDTLTAQPEVPTSSEPTATPEATAPPAPTPHQDEAALQQELRAAGISTFGWKTDFSKRSVPLTEIMSGGPPRDGIPPIDAPVLATIGEADQWLGDKEPVILFEHAGDARAYPLQIMTWHEIVNDEVGGIPVSVTFCPLCNSAITFDRRVDGVVYDFGTSGKLRNSDLVMWDRQTESWWQQFTGEAIVGELTGKKLTFLPSTIISWQDFKTFHPDGKALSRDTGFQRRYGENPYVGYDQVDQPPFLFRGPIDGRLLPKERVAAVTIDGVDAAIPFSALEQQRVVNYSVGGQDLVIFFKPGTQSALDHTFIDQSKDVGSTAVFDPRVDGQKLTFQLVGDNFVDNETGTVWDLLGEGVEGPLAGKTLEPIVHANHFWFAWGAFKPDTLIYQGVDG